MSSLVDWYDKNWKGTSKEILQLFKYFLDGKIKHGPAAEALTKDINMKIYFNDSIHRISNIIFHLAIHSFDSAIRKKLVKLLVEIRDLRMRFINPGNKSYHHLVLGEINEIIRNEWHCM